MDSFDVIGPVNLFIFAIFSAVTIVRLYWTYLSVPAAREDDNETWRLDEKTIVQSALLVLGIAEMLNGISLWVEHGYNVWGFALHITGQFATVVALLSFMMLWAKFLSFGDNDKHIHGLYWSILILNALAIITSISVTLTQKNFDDVGDKFGVVLLVNFLVLALSMLLISSWMALYGTRIYIRLRVTTPSPGIERQLAFSALRRVNLVLCVLVLCAALRILTLIILMVDILQNSDEQDDLGSISWFIFSNWIPTLGPGYILLFITRRYGIGGSQTNSTVLQQDTKTNMTSSLLTSEYTSTLSNPIMNSDSVYSSNKTFRTVSDDGFAMRMSSESHNFVPGHKYSEGEIDRDSSSAGNSAAYLKHKV